MGMLQSNIHSKLAPRLLPARLPQPLLTGLQSLTLLLGLSLLPLKAAAAAVPEAHSLSGRQVHLYAFSDTLPHPGLCALAEATSELGGTLRVIGLSKTPGYVLIHSHSPTLKFLMLQEVLEYEVHAGRIKSSDLVIFADGHDVLLQRSLVELVEAYDRWPGSPYLISGEKNCWPWPHSDASHGSWDPGMEVNPNSTWTINRWMQITPVDFCRIVSQRGPYRYPNIGLSMGPVWRMIEVLKRNNRIVLDEDVNDQGAMWLVILRHAEELHIEIDQNAEVFMNMLEYQAGDLEREPCDDGWFADVPPSTHRNSSKAQRPRQPPRNRLTKTTPSLLHFNGPSHEDGVWPTCYYSMSNEFRAVGRGHTFFDVDHRIYVSTDQICDYSFYHIHNFHAHPLHSGTLHFLEDFRALPVDPGLLAWRGTASAVDVARLGREADLHTASPQLHQALTGGAPTGGVG
mmetsp:Transcript_124674/g.364120  ORF Transcript_124674/g.364120 Transcript_124674/m.364120 type:complete len:457 (-) Transcript_124674:170-1540(-)